MPTRVAPNRSIANGTDLHHPAHLTAAWGLVFALAVTFATLGLRFAMARPLGPTPMLVIFIVPIVLSAYVGGLRPGLLATALSCGLSAYFLLPPFHSFRVAPGSERWDVFFVALAGVTISALTEALHRARHRGAVATSKQQRAEDALLPTGALQNAIFNSANFSSIATDAHGVIQIFNVGAERMLGYAAADVVNRINPADLSDSPELVARATALSVEFGVSIAPGFEALVFKASRGIEDIYELTYIRKDKSRFPAVVSVTALRDAQDFIIGYLLIGTDNTARKQAEDELLKAGALQRAIFNSTNFSSIATDANGVIQIFNVGAERMLGYAAADVVNRINPADLSDSPELVARAAALSVEFGVSIAPGFEALVFKASRGIEDIYELTYIRKDKSRFPAVVSVTALRDAQDFIIGYLLIGTDNTARKQAEEELLKAGALQRAIFNSATFSCIATDAAGVIQIFNAGAERMLGYEAADVVNKITPADLHDPQEVIERAAALSIEFNVPIAPGFAALAFKANRGIEDIYELTKIRRDGSRLPAIVSVTALRDPRDVIIGYLLIGTDNSARQRIEVERQQAEEARRVSDTRYRALFENAPDGIIVADHGRRYLDVNDSICRMLGYSHDELIALRGADIVAESEFANLTPTLSQIRSEGTDNREWRFRRKDGSTFEGGVITTVMPDGNILAMIRDITERKRFEAALQQQNVDLIAASRLKSEFLANMSHELRTPLNSIIGFSEVLRDGLLGEMTEQQRGFIGDISSSGNHLLSLINDILDLSKVEAGKMELDLEPVEISPLFLNSLSILREKAAKNDIHVELDASDEVESIVADPRKVKQIVYNLLSNAIKFSSPGGQVLLRARRVARSDVGQLGGSWPRRIFPLAASDAESFIEIVVHDDGIGISPGGLTQLFTPFSQIDSGLARKFEGTGLGLAMVKLLAELHGGTMAVESIVGEGSSFTVWLPVRGSEDRPSPRGDVSVAPRLAAPAWGTPAGGRVALVVEGDPKSAELIRVQLVAEGFEVLQAASAERALVLAMQQPLSLITLDIMLPQMDGWDFLTRIRQVPALRRVPVVIISIVADRTRGFALGASAVMEKPISRQQLFEALADLAVIPLTPGTTLKVLVVDDDPKAVELIAQRVERFAGTVLRAYGGQQGIDLARLELPDVIVLDLMMPEVSGFAVVDALREQPATARIPILVVTAKMITAEDRAMLKGYVSTIMTKTDFGLEHFSSEVRRAMAGRHVEA